MTPLAAYVLLFVAVGVGFIFVHLVAGKLIRPNKKNPEKDTIYECGEPTIGSAWVQFDLRFYVVALLFVIFDVEVAFFFPWAEIFGKANAIRASATPTSREQYNEFAAKVNDLASPRGSTSGSPAVTGLVNSSRERDLWRKLETMDDKEFAAYAALRGEQGYLTRVMRSLGDKRHEAIRSLTPAQFTAIKKHVGTLDQLLARQKSEQAEEAAKMVAALKALPPEGKKELDRALKPPTAGGPPGPGGAAAPPVMVANATDTQSLIASLEKERGGDSSFRSRALVDLRQVSPADLDLIAASPAVEKVLLKLIPERAKAVKALAARQRKELVSAAESTRDALVATGKDQSDLWDVLSLKWLVEFAAMSPEKLEAVRTLTPEGLTALEEPLPKVVKERADTLAWLALGEILVFFGVLLVGFAYLWKRGDLAWVRSTAAETTAVRGN